MKKFRSPSASIESLLNSVWNIMLGEELLKQFVELSV